MENDVISVEEDKSEESHEKELRYRFQYGLFLGIVIGVLFLGACLGIYNLVVKTRAKKNDDLMNSAFTAKVNAIDKVIEELYYQDVDEEVLREGVYNGLLEALDDPYSEYYTEEELTEAMNEADGISYGIGAYVSIDKETLYPVISGTIEGTPAREAGLLEQDVIYMVDGVNTYGMSLQQVVKMVKGLENTTVHLTIYREGEDDYLEMDVLRKENIETVSVEYGTLIDDEEIGYLRIREFDDATIRQFKDAMSELREMGVKGLIFDLRGNPGGNLNAVVDICRDILPEGLIVYTETKKGERKEYTCDGSNELDIPLVVLVNQYSASASEIMSGAIQDYNKGTIIGTTTFGKGVVQKIISLNDGTAVKITSSTYYTPSGRCIHGIGIVPDIELEMDYKAYREDGTDNQVNKAIEVLRQQIG